MQSFFQLFGLAKVIMDLCNLLINGIYAIKALLAHFLVNDAVVRNQQHFLELGREGKEIVAAGDHIFSRDSHAEIVGKASMLSH